MRNAAIGAKILGKMRSLVISRAFMLGVMIFLQFATVARAEESSSQEKNTYLMCRLRSVIRTVRVEQKGAFCKTVYTKEGVDQIVAKSGTSVLCFDVAKGIRNNLEKAAWKCKDISESRVSSLSE